MKRAKEALRNYLLENKGKVCADLDEMRSKSVGHDICSYVNNLKPQPLKTKKMRSKKIKTPNYSRREMTFGEFVLYVSVGGAFLIAISVGIVNGFYDKKIERTERKIKSMKKFTEEDAERAENARKQPLNHVWQ